MRLSLCVGLLSVGVLLSCGKSQNSGNQRDAASGDGAVDGPSGAVDVSGAGGSGGFNVADAGNDARAGAGGTAGQDAGTGLGGSIGIGGTGGTGGVSVTGGAGGTNVQTTGGSSGFGGTVDTGGPDGSRDAPAQTDAPGTGGMSADAPIGGSPTGGVGGSLIDARPDVAGGGQSDAGGADTGDATGGSGGANCGDPAGPASNPCQSVVCTQPPVDACVDGTTLRHYDADGICVRGTCKYAYRNIPCSGGCGGGVCQGEACGAMSCNAPAAASCTDTSTFSVPAPLGVCTANACSFAAAQITCTKACSGSGCPADDKLTEKAVVEHALNTPAPAFILDSGNQPRFAWCEKGVLHYRYRGATGWQTVDVDTDPTLDTNCGVVMTLDASDRARLAYGNSTAKTLRFAEETASGAFTTVTPVYNDAYGLSLASMPSGEPAIAYVAGPDYGRTLSFVSRNGASWNIENVVGSPTYNLVGRLTQMAIAADGTVHLLNSGDPDISGASDVSYARRLGTTWDVRFIKDSVSAARGLVLDTQGRPTILTYTRASTNANTPSCDVLWTFAADGTTLLGERVMCNSGGGPVLPDAYGVARVDSRYRLAWEIWAPVGEVSSYADVRVGSDGVPRYLVPTSITTEQDALVRSPCRPICEDRDCGPDGCGGVCGTCAGCATCGENGHCNAVPSERVTRLPGQPIPTAMPTVSGAYLAPDGQIMVRNASGSAAQLGTTGQWGQTVSLLAGATLLSGGGQLYALKGRSETSSSLYRWDIYRWDGATWPSLASLEVPLLSSMFDLDKGGKVAVDGGGNLHFVYVDPGDTYSKPQRLMQVTVSPSGTVGQPEAIVSTGTTNDWATIDLPGVVAGAANVLHTRYRYGTRATASASFVYEYRHAVSGMGSWPQTTAPTGMKFDDGVVDAQGTLWIRMETAVTVITDLTSGYATRKSNGQWTFPTMTGTTFVTQKMPYSSAPLFSSPSGGIYSFKSTNSHPVYYKLDAAADTWTQIAADIGDGGSFRTFDAQGVLHVFAIESPAGVDNLRHWWFTPP